MSSFAPSSKKAKIVSSEVVNGDYFKGKTILTNTIFDALL
jgi:hypothetical protein